MLASFPSIEYSAPVKAGMGGTFLVAASDASPESKARAHFQANGTADDVTIQKAIDALASGGGKVTFTEGQFNLAARLNAVSNLTLQGMGWSTIFFLANSSDVDMLAINNDNDVTVRDMKWDGNKANNAGNVNIIHITGTSTRAYIENLWVLNADLRGIRLGNVAGNTVLNNLVDSPDNRGILLEGAGADDNLIEGNTIESSGSHGISILGGKRNRILGNHVFNSDTFGISLELSGADRPDDCVIMGNVTRNSDLEGIQLTDCSGCIVVGNRIQGTDEDFGLSLLRADYNLIAHNSIKNAEKSGLSLETCDFNIISQNVIRDCVEDDLSATLLGGDANGITIQSTSLDNRIEGNQIIDTRGTKLHLYGIAEFTSSNRNRIVDNTINGVVTGGVLLIGEDTTVRDNAGYADSFARSKFISDMLAITGDTPFFWLPKEGDTTNSTDVSRNGKSITYSKDVTTFDDPPGHQGRGLFVHLDGVDEQADTPDSADLSFGNGTADSAFSIVALLNTDDATSKTIISKYDDDAADEEEWRVFFDASDQPVIQIYDDSVPAHIGRLDATAWGDAAYHLLITTYDATEASSGINIYKDAVVVDDTDSESGVYVATQDGDQPVRIGTHFASSSETGFYNGKMGFILVCAKELSADEVWQIKELVNAHYSLTL